MLLDAVPCTILSAHDVAPVEAKLLCGHYVVQIQLIFRAVATNFEALGKVFGGVL